MLMLWVQVGEGARHKASDLSVKATRKSESVIAIKLSISDVPLVVSDKQCYLK